MSDGFSIVASVITIVQAVYEAVKYAKAIYRASNEFEALQVWLNGPRF